MCLRKVLLPRLINYMIFVLGSANRPSSGGSTLLGGLLGASLCENDSLSRWAFPSRGLVAQRLPW